MFDFPGRGGGRMREYTRTSVGSGFVFHPDGYIITNAHVVARTAEQKVTFADGAEYDARIIAYDTQRDLAMLKIDANGPLPMLPLGRSDDLMIGETVIAIGNPLGLQNTVTAGVISAVDRDLDFPGGIALTRLIQTDASINPGNSGGPLLNVLGELVGVNTAIRGDAQNIGFAIPVDQLREALPELLDVERRYNIVTGLEVASQDGPRVTLVRPDSPASRAGLRNGDVIASINGRAIERGVDYHIAMIGRRPGESLPLMVRREGKTIPLELTIDERPAPDGAKLALAKLGIELYPLPQDVAAELGLNRASGLLVVDVERASPAESLGISPRDVLIAIGNHHVSSLEEVGQLLDGVPPQTTVPLSVLRVERRGILRLSGRLQAR
jgi:serine protease Do